MSPQISEEVMLLLMSVYGGLVLVLCYDVVRIFRRIFSASIYRVIIEDIIFWTIASIFMFDIFLQYNYGSPRFFAIAVALGIMALYEWLIGRRIVDKVAVILKKMLKFLLKPLKKALKVIKLKSEKVIRWIRKKVVKCPNREKQDRVHKEEGDRAHKVERGRKHKAERGRKRKGEPVRVHTKEQGRHLSPRRQGD